MRLFRKEQDYAAFERVLVETFERTWVRILAYCVMPSHWHLLLWPRKGVELSEVLRWLTRRTAKRLGLESTLRNPGRPRKAPQP